MRIVLLCCVASLVTTWSVMTLLEAGRAAAPPYDPLALDLEDRLASLEGRLARLADEVGAPALRGAPTAEGTPEALAARVTALEAELARLRREAREAGDAPDLPWKGGLTDPPFEGPERPKDRAEAARKGLQTRIERARRLPAASRAKPLAALAREAGGAGLFALQEALLREVVENAGEDSAEGAEALYQIGWARRNGGDPGAAREAWLRARDRMDAGHWRHGYARLYAAEMGYQAGEPRQAARELEDLLRDIDARPAAVDPHGTLRQRSEALLAAQAR